MAMYKLVVSKGPLFPKWFGVQATPATSDRLLVVDDTCPVMLTHFVAKRGFHIGVRHKCDEVVYVIKGEAVLTPRNEKGAKDTRVRAGYSYFVPAGLEFNFEVIKDVEMICFFSRSATGVLPEIEQLPEGIEWKPDSAGNIHFQATKKKPKTPRQPLVCTDCGGDH